MRKALAALAVAAIAALPSASHAASAPADVIVAGFQFLPGGFVTTNPFGSATPVPVAGTPLDRPSIAGSSIRFLDLDALSHSIVYVTGPFNFTPNNSSRALNAGATTTISGLPTGTYTYKCGIHPGMQGSFKLV